ncbi:MAG: HAD family phosphatase [Lachnospiraceae bacterium]|nr:HAD family phosphatase [Lachnospiraceae bacterium]
MIKLIATDVDGTLVKVASREIDPGYFRAIGDLKKMGISVAVVSGRQEDSMLHMFSPVLDDLYIVSNNGACIRCNGKTIRNIVIPNPTVHILAEELRKFHGCNTMLSSGGRTFRFPEMSEESYEFCTSYGSLLEDFPGYDALPPVNKICVLDDIKGRPHPAAALSRSFDGVIGLDAGDGWYDFINSTISKGSAVQFLQKELGAGADETAVFGDQENDMSMFAYAKYNFAVEGAAAIVYDAAAYHAGGYAQKGVLRILENIVRNNGVLDV